MTTDIKTIADAMRRSKWIEPVPQVSISQDGQLLDGQFRLTAILNPTQRNK